MTVPDHAFLEVGRMRLHHLEWGAAIGQEAALGQASARPPIVCLHGVTGHAWIWHDVAATLAATGRRVLALDLRGHGDSQWSAMGQYTTADHARDLEARLELHGIDRVELVGASWGGLIALLFAATHPEQVTSLTLIDVAPSFAEGETDVPARPAAFADHAAVLAWERDTSPHAPAALLNLVAAHGTRPAPGGLLERKHDPLFLERWPFRTDDRWSNLETIESTLLVVHARDSAVVSADIARRMVASSRRASLVTVADCGHVVPLEQPGQLARAIVQFSTEEGR